MSFLSLTRTLVLLAGLFVFTAVRADHPQYPIQRPARATPAAAEGTYTIHLDQPRQLIEGLGFEIQSDSIGSANKGLPELPISVPHDLTPPERQRFLRKCSPASAIAGSPAAFTGAAPIPKRKPCRVAGPPKWPSFRR